MPIKVIKENGKDKLVGKKSNIEFPGQVPHDLLPGDTFQMGDVFHQIQRMKKTDEGALIVETLEVQ